jgi:hypothetical protein
VRERGDNNAKKNAARTNQRAAGDPRSRQLRDLGLESPSRSAGSPARTPPPPNDRQASTSSGENQWTSASTLTAAEEFELDTFAAGNEDEPAPPDYYDVTEVSMEVVL